MNHHGHDLLCRIVPADNSLPVRVFDAQDTQAILCRIHELDWRFPLLVEVELWWVCPELGAVKIEPLDESAAQAVLEMRRLHNRMDPGRPPAFLMRGRFGS